ncbi:response regulator [Natronosalvus caseinilyticus]|uniref:response regulator n=1 Tax=Natronosalvus caseinilyticus TaxID=2953747 RepID=UPI0028B11CE9|nr:response regulator [Natronosalvus caseinilyticus]
MKIVNNQLPSFHQSADILLVEDNAGDVRLTEEAFKDGRIANTLYVVNDGVRALDFLYQRGEYTDAPRPHVVLLDLNLPRMNGDEVLQKIRADSEFERLPIIVLTTSEAQHDFVRSIVPDADAYLEKPVDPDDFIDTVRTFESVWLSVGWVEEQEE